MGILKKSRAGRTPKPTPKMRAMEAAAAAANKKRETKRMEKDINSLGQRLKGLLVKPSPTPQSVSNAKLNALSNSFASMSTNTKGGNKTKRRKKRRRRTSKRR